MYEAWTKADTEKMNQIEVLKSENKRLREALDSVLAGEHTDRQLRNIARAALRGEGEK